jgi:hypothetical protein
VHRGGLQLTVDGSIDVADGAEHHDRRVEGCADHGTAGHDHDHDDRRADHRTEADAATQPGAHRTPTGRRP